MLLPPFTAETSVFNLTPCKLQTLTRGFLNANDFCFLCQGNTWLAVWDVRMKEREGKIETFWFHESVNMLFLFIPFSYFVSYDCLLVSQINCLFWKYAYHGVSVGAGRETNVVSAVIVQTALSQVVFRLKLPNHVLGNPSLRHFYHIKLDIISQSG